MREPPSASELRSECRDRIKDWEGARTLRGEREAAEAFTRAFAELDEALSDGTSLLPPEWDRIPTQCPQCPWARRIPWVLPRPQDRLLHVFVVDHHANERPWGWRNPEAGTWP